MTTLPGQVGTPNQTMRWPFVDRLRGVAVLLVLFRHHPASGVLGEFGWLGVDLFFVLSGFLVSGLVFDEIRNTGRFAPGRFLIRRGFKIYPSFYFFILVTFLLKWAMDVQAPILAYLNEILFLQNYRAGLWVHTWSLAVEEHFYILLVLITVLLVSSRTKLTWRAFLCCCILIMIGCSCLRALHLLQVENADLAPTHLRLDSLLGGVLLAGWHRFRPRSFYRAFTAPKLLLLSCVAVLLLPVLSTPFGSFTMFTFGLTGAFLAGMVAVGMAVAAGQQTNGTRWLQIPGRWLAWVGTISYTIYLWHLLVIITLDNVYDRVGHPPTMTKHLIFFFFSILVGWLTARTIERYGLHLRQRFFPATAKRTLLFVKDN